MYQRAEKNLLQNRLQEEPRRFIQVIYGPRQVGKTTLMNQVFKDKKLQLYYWREGNEEVDFVVQYKGQVIALEVKAGKKQAHSGLNVFAKAFNPHKSLLIGDDGIPWQEFLLVNATDLF